MTLVYQDNFSQGTHDGTVVGPTGALELDVYRKLVLADTPVAYWRLGETSGTTANDISGNGRHGTYQGGVTLGQPGALVGDGDAAAWFDGVDDAVSVSNNTAFNFTATQDFSVECWLRGTWTQHGTLIEKWSGDGSYPFAVRVSDTGLVGCVRYDGTNNPGVSSPFALNDNQWHHLVFLKRLSNLLLYIDGQQVATTTDTTTGDTTNTSNLYFGKRGNNVVFYTGLLDEVAIYNYALSAEQVAAHYAAGVRSGLARQNSGTRVSPPIDLSSIRTAWTARADWQATTPAGTSLAVELSTDGGLTWTPLSNGGQSPRQRGGSALLRQTLSSQDWTVTPQLHDLSVTFEPVTLAVTLLHPGGELDLTAEGTRLLTALDGLGMAPVERIAERGPQQHGESDLGFRLRPRRVPLVLMAKGGTPTEWAEERERFLRALRPTNDPLQLRVELGGKLRQLDCYYAGELALTPEVGLAPRWQRVAVELLAPDPTWYEPVERLTTVAGGGGTGFAVPTPVPSSVGSSDLNVTVGIDNPGTWDALPVIEIDGPITSPKIENLTTNEKLDFSGVTIPSGQTYRIDCRYGQKSVTRVSDGANRIQDLTADSNLATFHLAAGVTNTFRVTGTGIQSNTAVRIRFTPRFVGV